MSNQTPQKRPDLSETKAFLTQARKLPEEIRHQIAEFFPFSGIVSTWHIANRDRARLTPLEYMNQSLPTVFNTAREITQPPQTLYTLAVDVFEAFLNGYVAPDKLQRLESEAGQTASQLRPALHAIFEGAGNYSIAPDACGLPKVITDAFYPPSIAKFVRDHTNPQGLVTLTPECVSLLKAMIEDEVSDLQRICPPDRTP